MYDPNSPYETALVSQIVECIAACVKTKGLQSALEDFEGMQNILSGLQIWNQIKQGADLLHLSTDRRVEVNPIDIELLYHCQSSTLSSSNISAATNWSSPCLCALRAAADQPFRTADLLTGTSGNTARRISRRAVSVFCIATSLSKIGLSSRSSSARKRNVVITKIYCFLLQRYSIFINNAFSLAFFLSKWETKGIFVIIGYVQ